MDRDNIIQKIIDNVDIVEEVSKDIALTKKGNNFVGLCPFHDDTNPSFSVSPEKKICHCFVCKNGGNVISYRQKYNKMSFNEALKMLANQIGIKMDNQVNKPKNPIIKVNEQATKFYHQTLTLTKQGDEARQYLLDRQIDQTMIERHQLGFSSRELNVVDYLQKFVEQKEFSNQDVLDSHLKRPEAKYDSFSQRIVIPINDEYGRCVGFSGRAISDKQDPKYLNSPDTPVFDKGSMLYNFDLAKDNLNNGQIIIVEGFFDAFSFEKQGIFNVAGIMGTGFTYKHIKLLKKYNVKQIILSLDQDKAGVETTLSIANDLLANEFELKVIVFDGYKDVDEYARSGKQLPDLIDNAISIHQFKMNHLTIDENNYDSVKKGIVEILRYITPDTDEFYFYVSRLSEMCKLSEEKIIGFLDDIVQVTKPVYQPQEIEYVEQVINEVKQPVVSKLSPVSDETILLKVCLQRKGYLWVDEQFRLNNNLITDPTYLEIYKQLGLIYAQHPNVDELSISYISDYSDKDYYQELEAIYRVQFDETKIEAIVNKPKEEEKTFMWMNQGVNNGL